jgi:hypothetical protein
LRLVSFAASIAATLRETAASAATFARSAAPIVGWAFAFTSVSLEIALAFPSSAFIWRRIGFSVRQLRVSLRHVLLSCADGLDGQLSARAKPPNYLGGLISVPTGRFGFDSLCISV